MVAQLFQTAQPDLLNLAELARLHRKLGLRLQAGWREPMGETTQRAVTLSIDGSPSAEQLVVELLRLAGVGCDVLLMAARAPDAGLQHVLWHAQHHDRALQHGLGLAPSARAAIGAVRIEEPR